MQQAPSARPPPPLQRYTRVKTAEAARGGGALGQHQRQETRSPVNDPPSLLVEDRSATPSRHSRGFSGRRAVERDAIDSVVRLA